MEEYSEEQRGIRSMVRDFARKEIAPGAADRDRTGRLDYDLYRRMGELGITGTHFRQEYGGSDAGFFAWCLVVEEIGRVDAALSVTLMVATEAGRIMIALSGPEQKERWLDSFMLPIVRGEATAGVAITEPDAGSDTRGIRTTAVLDGDEWVINGSKMFTTNAGLDNCAFVTVVCLTDREKREFNTIVVPTGTPGYRIMPAMQKMGLRSSDTRELSFDDCRVPAHHLLGSRGGGRSRTVRGLYTARVCLASMALGVHEESLALALDYAKGRVAFGRPISRFQHVQGMLAEIALEAELSRLLRDKAARLVEAGEPHAKEAAMVKWFCCESAKRATDAAVQVFGGMGYMDETPVSRYYRDIRAATIADGTTEIQKHIVARELGCLA